ncbi:MAG: cell division septal protein FtsQ [Candidatus Paceibacteria bacterium]|jgi:cell division septal protein FtsQ
MKARRNRRLNPDTFVLLKHIFAGFLVLGCVALLVVAVWYGTRVEPLTITSVEVIGGETIQHGEIERMVNESLKGTYFGLIPRQFAWFYPESGIRTALEGIDRIRDLSIGRVSGNGLIVAFDEYIPQALWCGSTSGEDCLFLDNTGYSFGHAPNLSGGSFLRFVKTAQKAVLYTSITSTESFDTIVTLSELLAAQNWFVSLVEIDLAGDAFLQMSGGGELKVKLSQPPEEIVDNLLVVLSSVEFEHITPGNFQYIDLRYGNKVFVNEEIAAPEEETASSSEQQEGD